MTAEEEAIHNELRAVKDALVAAINESDVDAILEHVHDNVVFTGMNGEVTRGRDELRAFFERMMAGPDRILESLTIDVTVDALTILYGGDTGVVYGNSVDNYKLTSGLEFDVTTRWSSTLVKEGDRISQGDAIAKVGATGRVSGPHLDWRMNLLGNRLDPQLLVGPMAPR